MSLSMRLLITGGAGCLGTNLIEEFLPAGHDVCILDNFATGKRAAVAGIEGLIVHEGSVADGDLVDRVFETFRPTHVIHSAAAYKDPDDWLEDVASNVAGTINVARAARKAGVRRLVNFQTALCYGRPAAVPIPVDAPVAPFTSYGISKAAGEHYLALAELPVVSLRLANVTGPRLAIGPIPTFYKRLKEGKPCFCSETVRDFLDMRDFLALMHKVLADGAPTGIYNVSTGHGNTIKDIFDTVVDYLGIELSEPVKIVPAGDDDVSEVVLDPSLTERDFGWKAQISFRDTIRDMLAWYDRHGVSDIYSHLSAPGR